MQKSTESQETESDLLASKLKDYARKFSALMKTTIPCWIRTEGYGIFPNKVDSNRQLYNYAVIEARQDELSRILLLYADQLDSAKNLLALFEELGTDFADLSSKAKAVVYSGWCDHFLHNENNKIAFLVEALFPSPNLFSLEHPQQLAAEKQGIIEICQHSGRHSEIYITNLAEAALFFTKELVNRLGSAHQSLNLPNVSEFCCSVGREDERRRPKHPEEILPIVKKLKMKWLRADDPSPYNSQQLIDDLWADMDLLGWTLPACPKLTEIRARPFQPDSRFHRDQWRDYRAALSQTEQVAQQNISMMTQSGDGNDAKSLLVKADDVSVALKEEEWWFASNPPKGSKYQHGTLDGCFKDLATWMNIDKRTLKTHNGKTGWWITRIHVRRYKIWFSDNRMYAKANQRRLELSPPDDMK